MESESHNYTLLSHNLFCRIQPSAGRTLKTLMGGTHVHTPMKVQIKYVLMKCIVKLYYRI